MDKQNWERRTLGRTGFEVTALGIGSAWLGHKDDTYTPELGVQTVLAGLESGINLIDTSDNYIAGRSEGFVGEALQHWFGQGHRREDLILSTKLTVHPGNLDAFSGVPEWIAAVEGARLAHHRPKPLELPPEARTMIANYVTNPGLVARMVTLGHGLAGWLGRA